MNTISSVRCNFPIVRPPGPLLSGGKFEQGYVMSDICDVLKLSPALEGAHKLLQQSDPIGRVGHYRAVYHLSHSIEAYTPDLGSNPGPGEVGIEELMHSISFTTYAFSDLVDRETLIRFAQKLANIHPWEHPIIEISSSGSLEFYSP